MASSQQVFAHASSDEALSASPQQLPMHLVSAITAVLLVAGLQHPSESSFDLSVLAPRQQSVSSTGAVGIGFAIGLEEFPQHPFAQSGSTGAAFSVVLRWSLDAATLRFSEQRSVDSLSQQLLPHTFLTTSSPDGFFSSTTSFETLGTESFAGLLEQQGVDAGMS
jgi:hypothetical protein